MKTISQLVVITPGIIVLALLAVAILASLKVMNAATHYFLASG